MDVSDMSNELSMKALQAYYRLVPTKKPIDYVVNYLKRVVHNHTMNIISENTSSKKARNINVSTKLHPYEFELKVVSENQLNESEYKEFRDQLTEDTTPTLELTMSVSTLLAKYKAKQVRFLKILMGVYDEEFTKFLREKKVCPRNKDNTDITLYISCAETRKLLCEYFDVSSSSMNWFVSEVRSDLGDRYAA
jgi:hypothetical protein